MTKTVISCQQRVRQGCLEVMQMRGTFPTACLIHSRPEQARPGREGAAQYSRGGPESQRTFRTVAHPPETKTAGGPSLPCPSAHRANYFLAYYSLNIPLSFFFFPLKKEIQIGIISSSKNGISYTVQKPHPSTFSSKHFQGEFCRLSRKKRKIYAVVFISKHGFIKAHIKMTVNLGLCSFNKNGTTNSFLQRSGGSLDFPILITFKRIR